MLRIIFVPSHNIYENKAEKDKNFVCKFMCKVVDIVRYCPYFNVLSIILYVCQSMCLYLYVYRKRDDYNTVIWLYYRIDF